MAALYLCVSCYFTVAAASAAVSGISENEKSFRSRLFKSLLLDNEYEELAGKHYRMAIGTFSALPVPDHCRICNCRSGASCCSRCNTGFAGQVAIYVSLNRALVN